MSRKPVIIILIFAAAIMNAEATETLRERFANGNQLYEKGDFSGALDVYENLAFATVNWKLYYNIGNCYFKMNQPVQAKIFYLRARRLRPFEASISRNLEIINKMLKDQVPQEKSDFIANVVKRIETLLPLNLLSALLLLALLFLNGFIFALLQKKGNRKWMIYGFSFLLVLTIGLSLYHIHRLGQQKIRNTAVIVTPDSELRSGPGENNTILFRVNPGLAVKILEKSQDWYQVSATSEIAGWIQQEALEII